MSRTKALVALLVVTWTVAGCGHDAAVKNRLNASEPLTEDDIARTLEAVGRAMSGRGARVRQGALTRQLDEKERAQLFNVLGDPRGLADAGRRTIDGTMVRGLRAPATSPQSEIEAAGTVWIDVNTLLPRRYELTLAPQLAGVFALQRHFRL